MPGALKRNSRIIFVLLKEDTEKLASRERGCQFRFELYRFDIMVKMPVFHSLVLSDVKIEYFF